jgi:UDP-glucose 4-epimerase
MKSIGVTGSTGFVGQRFLEFNKGRYGIVPLDLRNTATASLDLKGLDAILHLAGKAHQMTPIDEQIYFDVNTTLSKELAIAAKAAGVKQFVYISSTKVYGDDPIAALNEESECRPSDAYGLSKLQAEQEVQQLEGPGFSVAIIRPPLVYGPRVKGNMIRLLNLAAKKLPLPFGRSGNARSMVFIDNLVALINTTIDQQAAGVFLAGDAKPVETSVLIKLMRKELGNPYPLVAIPGFLRSIMKKYKPGLYTRLFGSFVADNSATNQRLHFTPPFSTAEGVSKMVAWFKEEKSLTA